MTLHTWNALREKPVLVASETTTMLAGLGDLLPLSFGSDARTGISWRFETGYGEVLDLRLLAARAWARPPFALRLRLVSSDPVQNERHVLAEAVIGTRLACDALERKITATMRLMIRSALAGGTKLSVAPLAPSLARPPQRRALALAEGWGRHKLDKLRDRLFAEHWAIGMVEQSVGGLIEGEDLAPVAWIDPGPFGDLADPHPWPGSDRILCEEMPHDPPGAPGQILSIVVQAAGPASPLSVRSGTLILGGGLHRSYPGTIVSDGELLLLPETPVRGETIIYRIADDASLAPVCWVAPGLCMADPTLFQHEGQFWIAYTDIDIGIHDNLCLLHAPAIAGPWTEHRGNPVKLDIRSSRPAGPVLRHKGMLVRPAQDCARTYGGAITLNRIDALTLDTFCETTLRRIEPAPGSRFPDGLHTLAALDGCDRILVDGKRLAIRPRALAAKLRRRALSFPHAFIGKARRE